jgi:putative ABC transport system permease protein
VDLLPVAGATPAPYAKVPSGGEEWGATSAIYRTASPGYFRSLGVRVLAGRPFTDRDRAGAPPVILVDDVLARRVWRGSPLGERLEVQVENFTDGYRVERVEAEVVGVVSAVPNGRPDHLPQGAIYLPLAQQPTWSIALAMRTSVPPDAVVEPARRAVAGVDPELPAYDVRFMEDVVRSTFALTDLALSLIAGLALLALVVSAAGLFGLIACVVRATGRDQAVRMACGASPGKLVGAQVRSGIALAGAGVALGLLLAWPAVRVLEGLLVGVSARDPITLAGAAGMVLATAAVSTLCAAVGILRVEPASVLRSS